MKSYFNLGFECHYCAAGENQQIYIYLQLSFYLIIQFSRFGTMRDLYLFLLILKVRRSLQS